MAELATQQLALALGGLDRLPIGGEDLDAGDRAEIAVVGEKLGDVRTGHGFQQEQQEQVVAVEMLARKASQAPGPGPRRYTQIWRGWGDWASHQMTKAGAG